MFIRPVKPSDVEPLMDMLLDRINLIKMAFIMYKKH